MDKEAQSLERRLKNEPGVVRVSSTAYKSWRSDDKVETTITVEDDITASDLTDLVLAIPVDEERAGLGGVETWRRIKFATGRLVLDVMLADHADQRLLLEGFRDVLTVRRALPEVSRVQVGTSGVASYELAVADDLPELLTLARRAAALSLRLPGVWWRFETERRGARIRFHPEQQPSTALVDLWQRSSATLDAVPAGFYADDFSVRGSDGSITLALIPPRGVGLQQIVPATYGSALLPMLRRQARLVRPDGSYEVTIRSRDSDSGLAADEFEPPMIAIGDEQSSVVPTPNWGPAWTASWERALRVH